MVEKLMADSVSGFALIVIASAFLGFNDGNQDAQDFGQITRGEIISLDLIFIMQKMKQLSLMIIAMVMSGTALGSEFRFKGGDVEEGKVAFERLNCIQCHRVPGVSLSQPKTKKVLNLVLGEEARFVNSYTDILLAITNPQHVVTTQYSKMLTNAEIAGEITAFMPDLIEDMSVAQFIDLVTFLDAVYQKNMEDYQPRNH